jgi:molybdate-binding protein
MLLVNLASWEQGPVVAAGNPLKISTAADLLQPKVRFVARESGAGAHKLLERALRSQHARLVNTLGSRAFRRELDNVGGYQTSASGHQVGDTRSG